MRKDMLVGCAMLVVSALEIAVAVAAGLRGASGSAVDTPLFSGISLVVLGIVFLGRGRRSF